MAGTFLGFPFDPEIFDLYWHQTPDTVATAMVESGAMVEDAEISRLISTGSDTYTIPFYGLIGGIPVNYDGMTDITATELTGSSQTGIVFGRAKAWKETQFVRDFNSGAKPMEVIASQVVRYWQHYRQTTMLGILNAVLGLSAMSDHVVDTAAPVSATMLGDAVTKVFGDYGGNISLAIMHSKVARALENLQLLEYKKYTDPAGITSNTNIAQIGGITVIVDDCVPTTDFVPASGSGSSTTPAKPATATTYLIGRGALRHASAPVTMPAEVARNSFDAGGQNFLINRIRETIHPDGFTFTKPSSNYTSSPTDAQLTASANWSLAAESHKTVAIASVKAQI